ncbi:MAG: type II toxin-antitoxin system RelE/ParE family toxin [Actinobacteria bacterium]|nr:type II toxin-antitoxin system RelE/ParE family toxin [Actinomycetota bacterium]
MARRRSVSFAESAVRDLEDVRDRHALQQIPEVGERLVREVVERVEQLAEFPDKGRIVPEFDPPWLRELVHPPFRIVYRLDADRARVVRVWRSERLMNESLGGNA